MSARWFQIDRFDGEWLALLVSDGCFDFHGMTSSECVVAVSTYAGTPGIAGAPLYQVT
jgi:hypothetical protein